MTGVVALGLMGLAAGGASAAQPMNETIHQTQDVTGQVFTCAGGDLTIDSGMISMVQHDSVDGQGIFHITATVTPKDVVLSDAAGNTYSISGAQWFGGKALSEEEPILFTDTEHFVIHDAAGGVYAKVQAVSHFSVDGASFTFDKGSCETPQD
ncbi:hypothetical protein FHX52_3904 [Humibacillus xanthopallidus]|uniref:Uncharacterized protein n=1 Tax=Humibacillus xanthopallidus TaxID=412689 RepID=A0A543PKU8_9MICO|nr:hypothetical protein [Humibacillus xanthopallidus]TQN44684.1 hypothetical protein FHX52_3904 [Humibacillus xanthopallidus]